MCGNSTGFQGWVIDDREINFRPSKRYARRRRIDAEINAIGKLW